MVRILFILCIFSITGCTKAVPEFFDLYPSTNDEAPKKDPERLLPTDILPLQESSPNWNDYFVVSKNETQLSKILSAPVCDPLELIHEQTCVHGGVLKKVVTNFDSCSDLTFHDYLNAFEWECQEVGPAVGYMAAVIYSKGLKKDIKLINLIDTTKLTWKLNFLTVTHSVSNQNYITESKAWWNNVITNFPYGNSAVLRDEGTIYYNEAGRTSQGFSIVADKISIINNDIADFSFSTASINCDFDLNSPNSPDNSCGLHINYKNFLWIEDLKLKGNDNTHVGLYLNGVNFSRFHHIRVSKFTDRGIQMRDSNNNFFNNIDALHTLQGGLFAYGFTSINSSYNRFYNIRTANNKTNGFELASNSTKNIVFNLKSYNNGDKGLAIYDNSKENIVTKALLTNNEQWGTKFRDAGYNTLSHATLANNVLDGINTHEVGSSHTQLIQILAAYNGQSGIDFGEASNNFATQIVSVKNNSAVNMLSGSNNNDFTENFIFGNNTSDCIINSSGTGGLDSSCEDNYGHPSNKIDIGSEGSTYFKASLDSGGDSVNNSDDSNGVVNDADLTSIDWLNFDNSFRAWGKKTTFLGTTSQGTCGNSGYCKIWDWQLDVTSPLKNKSYNGTSDNESYLAGVLCPSAVDGNKVHKDYLINAVEIVGDYIGNDDGLCNSYETCIYSPNFGYHQGDPSSILSGQCLFNDGLVKGVTMKAYSN